jgi:ABC-type Na+ efflux pump permease subunit
VIYRVIAAVFLFLNVNYAPVYGQQADSESGFIAYFDDVPLMKGLTELDDERVIFDTEAGTIAETVLVGKLTSVDILAFYTQSLNQLGWREIEAGHSPSRLTFTRDKQVLSLRLFDAGETKNLLVHLEPRN